MALMPKVSSNTRRTARDKRDHAPLPEGTRNGIVTVILLAVAGLSLLSFFDLAGPFGEVIATAEKALFGWCAYVFPIVLVGLGVALMAGKSDRLHGALFIGLLLFFLSAGGLLNLLFAPENIDRIDEALPSGGYLGYVAALPLVNILGGIGALLILLAVFVISILVIFNTSFPSFASGRSWLRSLFAVFKRKQPSAFEYQSLPRTEKHEEEKVDEEGAQQEHESSAIEEPSLKPIRKRNVSRALPPLSLLASSSDKPASGDVKATSERIQKTLENFGITVEMGDVSIGPTVTQYTLKPADGVKLSQIVTLGNDLALALAAHPIRIEAPIPGKSLVGIEVPNQTVAIVPLKDLLESQEFQSKRSHLSLAIGRDVAGHPVIANLAAMPHLLIAGATGSGKSVAIKSILTSLLYENTADDLKFILIDPKRVELTIFNTIPHLATPVITEVQKTVNALRWAVGEMDRRYRALSDAGCGNVLTYNERSPESSMPFIVIVIDELADLMASSANEVEGAIVRLAQMARAVGIHLVVATQRPSVDVLTGLIKANITTRIAFSVASLVDSRTILDTGGAEKLLGNGDMLYVAGDLKKPRRVQGAFISDKEIGRVVSYLASNAEPEYDETVVETPAVGTAGEMVDTDVNDDMYEEAKEIVVRAGKASASFLQRRLRIGYARAARLLDIMEERGVIGPLDGARPREILVQSEPPADGQDQMNLPT